LIGQSHFEKVLRFQKRLDPVLITIPAKHLKISQQAIEKFRFNAP